MTFKVSDFRNDVRGVLGDLGTDRHHSDTDIDFAVVDGIRRMRSVRPDSRYVNGVLVDYDFPSDADDIADFHVAFDERWRLGVVYYAAYRRFECDVVDAVNRELAASYLKQSDAVFAS